MNRIFGLRRSHRQCAEDPPTPTRNEQPAHGGEEEEPHGHAIDEANAPFIDLESEREISHGHRLISRLIRWYSRAGFSLSTTVMLTPTTQTKYMTYSKHHVIGRENNPST